MNRNSLGFEKPADIFTEIDSIKEHPFKYYYDKGIRVSLNTDNRLISNTNLSKEYFLASHLFNLDLRDIMEIIIMSMKSSFVPHQKRKQMIKNISNELENDFGIVSAYI